MGKINVTPSSIPKGYVVTPCVGNTDNATNTAEAKAYTDTQVDILKDGVDSTGDTLKKLRDLITAIQTLLNSNDANLDTLQEVVTYIKSNATVLEGVTISKVNVADIVDDLVHTDANKPLSANQGKALKALIDALTTVVTTKGDMLKSTYDTDGDGKVDKAVQADNATKVNNHTASATPTTSEQIDLVGMVNEVNNKQILFNNVKITDDFAGKVMGSITENPNIAKASYTSTALLNPSDSNWDANTFSTNDYLHTANLDGIIAKTTASITNGTISQHLFSFNLIRIIEDKFGTIPGTSTTADKVAWLKANISNLICNWWGYGSCPSGNKALLSTWTGTTWYGYVVTNASTPTLNTINMSSVNDSAHSKVDDNGILNILVSTDASDGTTPSTIYTDYISIEITLLAPSGKSTISFGSPRRDAGKSAVLLVDTTSKAVTSWF